MLTFGEVSFMKALMRRQYAVRLLIIATALLIPFLDVGSVYAQKISSSMTSITINEGGSQVIQLQLDAPIICPGGAPTCQVDLTLTPTDPSRVSVSPSTSTWLASEWPQTRTVTINTVDDGIYNSGAIINISGTAISNSVYFNGFQVHVTVNLINIDPVPPIPGVADKTVNVPINTTKTVDVLSGISGNPDSSTLTIVSTPTHGTAVDPPGTITYTPNTDYIGPDSLTYSVCSLNGPSICGTSHLNFNVLAASTTVPDTGYGSFQHKPYLTLLSYGSVCLGLLGLAVTIRKYSKL